MLRARFMLMVFHFFQTIGYYGFASWVPTLLIANGIGITSSLQFSFIIAISSRRSVRSSGDERGGQI